jgi:rod shape-determining protein MreD
VTPLRGLAVALVALTSVALQPVLISPLHLPLGTAQLPLVVLAVIALVEGSTTGMAVGFSIGLASDAMSEHPLGLQALVLAVVGWAAGKVHEDGERSVVAPLFGVLGVSAGALLGTAGLARLTADTSVAPRVLALQVAAGLTYALVLTPIVLPPLRALLLRLDPTIPRT